jgi:hypothetical protein
VNERRRRNLVALWTLLLPLLCGTLPTRAQDLKKLANDLSARIHAVGHDRVMVVDFVDLDKKPTKLGQFLSQQLQFTLAEPERKLVVVDQSQMPQLLDQMQKLDEGLLDPATGRKLGQMVGTEVLIVGTVMPSSLSVRLDVKAIDLETAKVISGGTASVTRFGLIDRLASESGEGGEGVSTAIPTSTTRDGNKPTVPRPPARSRVDQGIAFDLDGCTLSGDALECAITVTSENRDRWIAVTFRSRAWNNAGDENGPDEISIANTTSRYDCITKELLKNVPTTLTMKFSQFGAESPSVERLRLSWQEENGCPYSGWRSVDFEKLALSDSAAAHSGRPSAGAPAGKTGRAGGLLNKLKEKAMGVVDQVIDDQTNKLLGNKRPPQP